MSTGRVHRSANLGERLLVSLALFVCCSLCLQPAPLRAELKAGAVKVDITPQQGVSLDGPISKNGPVLGVHDPLHARALVLDDGNTRLALVICDACFIGGEVFDSAKQQVQARTGLPTERMLMAATHTHAAPRAVHIGTGALDDEYHRYLADRIATAVIQAEAQLSPAEIAWASFDVPEYVRCRRFLCRPGSVGPNPFGEEGERVKSVAGISSAILRPAGPVDPQFWVLSVRHSGGRPLAVLGNLSVHYSGGSERGQVSADYFGHYAAALEAELDAGADQPPFVGLMSNGTSGDTSAIRNDGQSYAAFEWMQVFARILAQKTLAQLENTEHRSDHTLQMQETVLELAVRRPDDARLAWARQMLSNEQAPTPHRWTRIYAAEAFHLAKFPATKRVRLQALRIGQLGIAAAPCEVFAETGLAIKSASPHAATFTIELANGYGGYLPSPEQHEFGGYETWPARSSFLEAAAEPRIRTELIRLLENVSPEIE